MWSSINYQPYTIVIGIIYFIKINFSIVSKFIFNDNNNVI